MDTPPIATVATNQHYQVSSFNNNGTINNSPTMDIDTYAHSPVKSTQKSCFKTGHNDPDDVLMYGYTRDQLLSTCAINIWSLSVMFNISLVVSHVKRSDDRVYDRLTKWHFTSYDYEKLGQLVQSPVWIDTHIDLTLFNHDHLLFQMLVHDRPCGHKGI